MRERFKDHTAHLTEHEGIQILEWREGESMMCGLKFIFSGKHIYISGDYRDAVYDCTWNTTLRNSYGCNFSYLTGKLSACQNEKRKYDSDRWDEDMKEYVNERYEEEICEAIEDAFTGYDYDNCDDCPDNDECECFNSNIKLEEFFDEACMYSEDQNEWIHFVREMTEEQWRDIGDEPCESQLWEFGEMLNEDLTIYWVALQMAGEQLYGKLED
jgi:hypothetical protein